MRPRGIQPTGFCWISALLAPCLNAAEGGDGAGAELQGLTASAAGLLVTAVHAVGICVATPAQGDAVAALALELVHVTARRAVFLWAREWASWSALGTPAAPLTFPPVPCPPHPSHLHSHGPHHISSAQQCSGRWHRKTHSQSRAEGLEGGDRPQEGGHRHSALGRVMPPILVFLKARVDWHNDENAQPILCGQLAALMGPAGHRGCSLPLRQTHKRAGFLALPSGHTVWRRERTDKTSTRV